VGVAMGSVFWGSNFIVCKGFDLPDDGMHFVMLMSIGILLVGICTLFFSQIEGGDFEVVLAPDGLLGGGIWALGNLLTVPILKNIGLGMGLAIWAGVNVIVSFVVGAVGLGSLLPAEKLGSTGLAIAGIALAVGALILFTRVKPTIEDTRSNNATNDLEDSLMPSGFTHPEEEKKQKSIPKGLVLASIAGVCYGFQFVPLLIWNNKINISGKVFDHNEPTDVILAMRFFFSQYVGIFVVSMVAFIIYTISKGNKPLLVPREAMIPAICSGVVWALGCAGGMLANSGLGAAVGFPLLLNISFLVNSSWSILYYKEIQGKTNLQYFGAAFLLNVVSSVLITLSRG